VKCHEASSPGIIPNVFDSAADGACCFECRGYFGEEQKHRRRVRAHVANKPQVGEGTCRKLYGHAWTLLCCGHGQHERITPILAAVRETKADASTVNSTVGAGHRSRHSAQLADRHRAFAHRMPVPSAHRRAARTGPQRSSSAAASARTVSPTSAPPMSKNGCTCWLSTATACTDRACNRVGNLTCNKATRRHTDILTRPRNTLVLRHFRKPMAQQKTTKSER
jgi:hypothetical protein